MSLNNKKIFFYLLTLIAFVFHLLLNIHNQQILKNQADKLRSGVSILTQDDISYLSPAHNYILNGKWKETEPSYNAAFKRLPGYSFFTMPALFVFKGKGVNDFHPNALWGIILLQCLLQAFIPALLYLLFLKWLKHATLSFVLAFLFGLLPNLNGFVFYTLTEGVSPFLVMVFVFCTFYKDNLKYYMIACLILGIILITRPLMAPLALLLIFPLINYWQGHKKVIFLGFILMVLPITMWQIRNSSKFNAPISLHNIYNPGNANEYRLPHQKIFNLVKLYQANATNFHDFIRDLKNTDVDQQLSVLDYPTVFNQRVIDLIGEDELNQQVNLYKNTLLAIPQQYPKQTYSADELEVAHKFESYAKKYRSEYVVQSYLTTPLLVFKAMIFHSNLNLYIFQHSYRGEVWMEILRWFSLMVHVLLFFIPLLGFVFFGKKTPKFLLLTIAIYFILAYLAFVQRGIEERYTYPLLPVLYFLSIINMFYLKARVPLKSKILVNLSN